MAVIPVVEADVLKALNLSDLSGKSGVGDLFSAHQPGVLLWLAQNTDADSYTAALTEAPSAAIATAYKLAYSLIMLKTTMEFLNLKTVGKGIVDSTGMDANKVQLITVNTIEKKKKALEHQALTYLKPFLSQTGKSKLINLSGRRKSRVRCALLAESTSGITTNWWDVTSTDESSEA